MEFFKHNTKIHFMRLRKITAVISLLLFIVSIASLGVKGLNWGLDFSGGTQVQLTFPKSVNLHQLRTKLIGAGFEKSEVQSYGSSRDALITIGLTGNKEESNKDQGGVTKEVTNKLKQLFPQAKQQGANAIGAKVSKELANKGVLAVLVSMILISIYIAFRFEYRMAISSAVALIHDPIVILGIFSLFHIEFGLNALAALLTVIGYSLNDTIVVFDRVRENFRKMRGSNAVEVVNSAINQTLSRTIMTSALTLIVVLALLFFGGPTIRSFSIALVVGIVIGTYSSIYVAGALAVALGLSRKDLLPPAKPTEESLQ
ncbi:MAG: protein translocase subunit SecF [Gammaproteobacteria bacterium]|nr:protein translocase subunit SecF [Gammaproteobacteria bacterium]